MEDPQSVEFTVSAFCFCGIAHGFTVGNHLLHLAAVETHNTNITHVRGNIMKHLQNMAEKRAQIQRCGDSTIDQTERLRKSKKLWRLCGISKS